MVPQAWLIFLIISCAAGFQQKGTDTVSVEGRGDEWVAVITGNRGTEGGAQFQLRIPHIMLALGLDCTKYHRIKIQVSKDTVFERAVVKNEQSSPLTEVACVESFSDPLEIPFGFNSPQELSWLLELHPC